MNRTVHHPRGPMARQMSFQRLAVNARFGTRAAIIRASEISPSRRQQMKSMAAKFTIIRSATATAVVDAGRYRAAILFTLGIGIEPLFARPVRDGRAALL